MNTRGGAGGSNLNMVNPYSQFGQMGQGIGSGIGNFLYNIFGNYKNPAESASPFYDQIPDVLKKYLSPYMQQGQEAYGPLWDQIQKLMGNPGDVYSQMGAGYKESPGYQFRQKQGQQAAANAAAAGGMGGSPQAMQNAAQVSEDIASQDFNNYMQNVMGLYGTGFGGAQNLYGTGAKAGMELGQDLSSVLANRGMLEYLGQMNKNQQEGQSWGGLGGAIGGIAGMALPWLMGV